MKRMMLWCALGAALFSITACGPSKQETAAARTASGDRIYRIALLVPFIGDQSYFDSANQGRLRVEEYPNVETTLIEMTEDKSKWEGYYLDACESGYDLIIGGNTDAEEFLYSAAERYPDQTFYNFDYVNHVDLPNVYANMYNTPELGYVAGAVVSQVTSSAMPKANPAKTVGVVVGMDIPAMNDFIGGFCQICIDSGVQVIIGYPESFSDAAKAKEIALNMYNQGADIIWQVAGGAGAGVFEAAAETGRYTLGVDSDQTISFAGRPQLAETIVTSMFKNVGIGVIRAVDMFIAGNYPSGTETLGIKENAVGMIENDQYRTMVPQEIRDEVQKTLDKVSNGEVQVLSALKDQAGWEAMKARATARR